MSCSFFSSSCVVFFFCGILMFGGISLVFCLMVRKRKNWWRVCVYFGEVIDKEFLQKNYVLVVLGFVVYKINCKLFYLFLFSSFLGLVRYGLLVLFYKCGKRYREGEWSVSVFCRILRLFCVIIYFGRSFQIFELYDVLYDFFRNFELVGLRAGV